MLTLLVNGVEYDRSISINVSRSLQNFLGYFQATTSADPEDVLPVKMGDAIEVLADGSRIFNGYVDALRMSHSANGHSISISGRDKTADIFDSTVTGQKSFRGSIGFSDLLRKVLNANGSTDIDIVNEVGAIEEFKSTEIVAAEVGQKIFDFIEPYARTRQLLITTNEDGNVLLMRSGTSRLGVDLVHQVGNEQNNIKSAELSLNRESRYNKYISHSQLNPYAQGDEIEPSDITSQKGQAEVDSDIRTTRTFEFNAEEDSKNTTAYNRARFEANIRRAKSLNYACVVQGHGINGTPYKINRLAFVNDDFADISSDMLLHSVEFSYSLSEGSTTTMEFTYPDAFSLEVKQKAREAARSLLGGKFG